MCNSYYYYFSFWVFLGKVDMAGRHHLSEAALQWVLAENTVDLIGDISFTEIYEPVLVEY